MTKTEAAKFLTDDYRIRIINAWRPLKGPVSDSPLAFCDPSSLSPCNLIDADRPAAEDESGAIYLSYSPELRWHYLSNHMPDELALFVSWDSNPDGSPACEY